MCKTFHGHRILKFNLKYTYTHTQDITDNKTFRSIDIENPSTQTHTGTHRHTQTHTHTLIYIYI